MANVTAKTSSNIFYKARCEAATHNEQLSSREGAADYEKDLSVSVEVDDVNVDTNIYLHERDIIESEIIHNTIDDYDEDSFDETARYCPDCGCKMNYENDMGAFCVNCAPNH